MDLFSEESSEKVTRNNNLLPKVGGYFWVDGLIYREPTPLDSSGVCGPNNLCTYDYLTGPRGIEDMRKKLEFIADKGVIFGIDFETSACKKAPIDPETGEFSLDKLSWSTANADSETGSDPHTSIVFLLAISIQKRHSYVVDMREALEIGSEAFREALGRACILGNPVASNMSFEWQFIKKITGYNAVCYFDPMIATQMLYAGAPDTDTFWSKPDKRPKIRASLDRIIWREVGLKLDKSIRSDFLRLHPESGLTNIQIGYVAGDTGFLLETTQILKKKLDDKKILHLWTDIESKFLPIISRNRYNGIFIGVEKVIELRKDAIRDLDDLASQWNQVVPTVSISSSDQLLHWIKEKYPNLDIKDVQAETLNTIVEEESDSELEILLAYKKIAKIESTYLSPWITDNRNPITGNIHPDVKQCETDTGRLNYTKPNLQNIPSKGTWVKLRNCFIAKPGYILIDVDLSQFEVRALADMAGEKGMIDFFWKARKSNDALQQWLSYHKDIARNLDTNPNYKVVDEEYIRLKAEKDSNDFHTLNTIAIFGDTFRLEKDEKLRIEMRGQAKGLSFGIPYGISAKKVARQFGVSEARGQELIDAYYSAWPSVKAYLESLKKDARYKGEARSCSGRYRLFQIPEHFKKMKTARGQSIYNSLMSASEREAQNCLDSETEALTQRGWIKGFDLLEDDVLLTKNLISDTLEWNKIEYRHFYPNYYGPIIECKSRNFHAVTTPNHNWVTTARKNKNKPIKIISTSNLSGDYAIHRTGENYKVPKSECLSEDISELIGWLLTDGGLYLNNKHRKQVSYKVSVFQSITANPDNVKRIDALFSRLNLKDKVTRYIAKNTDLVRWTFYGKTAKYYYNLLPNKLPSMELLLSLSSDGAKRMFEAICLADGTKHENRNRIAARSKEWSDKVEILATLCGISARTYWKNSEGYIPKSLSKLKPGNIPISKGCFLVNPLRRKTAQVTKQQKTESIQKMPVWCVTIPNNNFIVRRSGHIYLTGNSPVQGINGDVLKMSAILMDSFLQSLDSEPILFVHDEILASAPEDNAEKVGEAMGYYMKEAAIKCGLKTVPIDVQVKYGKHWAH